jgi:AcrR family transcriptional regulator
MSATAARTRRPDQRRDEIIEGALQQFAERGYHNTGVADIAAALRMSHGTFYRYFASKRDIIEQLVDELAARVAAAVAQADAEGDAESIAAFRAQVEEIAGALVGVVQDDPRIARLLLLEATGIDGELTEHVLAILDHLRELTAARLRAGVDAGFLRPDLDPVQTARAINGMVYAGALDAVRRGGNLERYVPAALRLLFDGIAA